MLRMSVAVARASLFKLLQKAIAALCGTQILAVLIRTVSHFAFRTPYTSTFSQA